MQMRRVGIDERERRLCTIVCICALVGSLGEG